MSWALFIGPNSGLLPGIGPKPGSDGSGDKRVQAYNFRMCLTDVPENRIPFTKPVGYDEARYELLFRNFAAGQTDPLSGPMSSLDPPWAKRRGMILSLLFIGIYPP